MAAGSLAERATGRKRHRRAMVEPYSFLTAKRENGCLAMKNVEKMRLLTGLGLFCLLGGWLAGGCATSVDAPSDDESTTSGEGGMTTSTTSTGGQGGQGGSTPPPLPCGIDCSTIQTDACHEAQCNMTTKQCEVVNAPNATACDDGVFCTTQDSCVDGKCVGGCCVFLNVVSFFVIVQYMKIMFSMVI